MTALLIKSFLFVLGLCLGSFCNVLIHRSTSEDPSHRSLWGRSHCPHCGGSIGSRDLVPLLSFLLLRGQCRSCGHAFTHRYWIVELVLAFACVGLYPLLLWGDTIGFVMWVLVIMGLVTLFFTDLEKGLLPDRIQIPLLVFLGIGTAWGDPHPFSRLLSGLIAAVVGWGFIWLLNQLYFKWRHQEGFGGGDAKMMAWMGVFFGWRSMLGIFFVAALLGTLWGLVLKIQKRGTWDTHLPFGSFLAVSAGIVALWGEPLWRFYLESVIS